MKTTQTQSPEQIASSAIERILNYITFHPEDRKLNLSSLGRSWTISVRLHQADQPRAVGAKGSHVRALTDLVNRIGRRAAIPISFRLLEPEVGKPERHAPFSGQEDWDHEGVRELATDICNSILKYPVEVTSFDGDNFNSNLEIAADMREPQEAIDDLNAIITPLFNAIGKAQGRLLTVDLHSA